MKTPGQKTVVKPTSTQMSLGGIYDAAYLAIADVHDVLLVLRGQKLLPPDQAENSQSKALRVLQDVTNVTGKIPEQSRKPIERPKNETAGPDVAYREKILALATQSREQPVAHFLETIIPVYQEFISLYFKDLEPKSELTDVQRNASLVYERLWSVRDRLKDLADHENVPVTVKNILSNVVSVLELPERKIRNKLMDAAREKRQALPMIAMRPKNKDAAKPQSPSSKASSTPSP